MYKKNAYSNDRGGQMKKTNLMIVFGFMILMMGITSLAGQDKPAMSEEEMMKKWMAHATPGKYHQLMAKKTGNWTAKTKMWQAPGQPPQESEASMVGEMILGGRYLKNSFKGMMMGMPFDGISIQGYDNHLKKYQSIWIDTTSTSFYISTGTVDESGKILTEWAETENFLTGKKEKSKTVTTMISDDQFQMEMFMIMPDGSAFKNMEVHYFRKK